MTQPYFADTRNLSTAEHATAVSEALRRVGATEQADKYAAKAKKIKHRNGAMQ